jgi:hypothetical protein
MFWWRTDTAASGPRLFHVNSSGEIDIEHSGSILTFDYGGGACRIDSTVTLSASTWYFIEVYWNTTTDVYKIVVNGTANTLTGTDCATATGATTMYLGQFNSTTEASDFDQFATSDDDGGVCNLNTLKDTGSVP